MPLVVPATPQKGCGVMETGKGCKEKQTSVRIVTFFKSSKSEYVEELDLIITMI